MTVKKIISRWPDIFQDTFPENIEIASFLNIYYFLTLIDKCDFYLYADDLCLVCQHKDIDEIGNQFNGNFYNLCDWFVDDKLQ